MIKENNTLLTIAIPNYNGGVYLEKTIKSVLNISDLDSNDVEILVIDNCSNDNSIEVIQRLQKDIGNLRLVINKTNLGRVGNRNRCIELAQGKFLLIEMVWDTIYPISLKDDLLEMEKDNIFIRYSSSQEIPSFKSYTLNTTHKIKLNLSFPFFSCRDDIFATYLWACILKLDIIRNNNILFDDSLTIVSDRKFLYHYLSLVEWGKIVSKKLLHFNTDRNDRATYSKMRFLFYDLIKLFDYYKINNNRKYNKNKLHFILMSEMLSTYFASKIKKQPTDLDLIELNKMRKSIKMWFGYFSLLFIFNPLVRIFFQLNANFFNFKISLFVISN